MVLGDSKNANQQLFIYIYIIYIYIYICIYIYIYIYITYIHTCRQDKVTSLWLLTIYWGLMKQNDLSVQETEHTNEILNLYELATLSSKHTKLADMNNCSLLPCFNSWSDSGVACRSTKSKRTVETNTSTRLWNPYQGLHTQGCNVFAPSMSPSVHHNTLKAISP